MDAGDARGSTLLSVADDRVMGDDSNGPTPDEPKRRMRWWPEKLGVPTGSNMGREPLICTQYAWWQWRQRLRTSSVKNLERFYLQPLIFGRKRN